MHLLKLPEIVVQRQIGALKKYLSINVINLSEVHCSVANAIAERINEILKNELGLAGAFNSLEQAVAATGHAVSKYNSLRPHDSCNRLMPVMAHQQTGLLKKHRRPQVHKQRAVEQQAP